MPKRNSKRLGLGNSLEEAEESSFDKLNVNALLEAISALQINVSQLNKKINVNDTEEVSASNSNVWGSGIKPEEKDKVMCDKSYVSLWRDLGGNNIIFSPNSSMHPVLFIRKVTQMMEDAFVPEGKRVALAIGCLRGSAADWGQLREDSFVSLEEFKKAFFQRYWSRDDERDLFHRLKYGKYTQGSRADYFLKQVKSSSYLSEKIPEDQLVEMIVSHFSQEIKRGIIISGLHTMDDVEKHLRKIDETFEEDNGQSNGNQNNSNNSRQQNSRQEQTGGRESNNQPNHYNNDRRNWRGHQNGGSNQGGRNGSHGVATIFNRSFEEDILSDDSSPEVESQDLLSK